MNTSNGLIVNCFSMGYFSTEEKENAKKYTYKGGDTSPVYSYILSPFAQFWVDLLPRWVAPNLITAIGLMFPIMASLLTLYYNPNLSAAEQPTWLSFYSGIALFIYQTMDNMDGKQARRTHSSSPFGMLFDHGCDAVNAVVFPIAMGGVLGTGWTGDLFLCLTTTNIPFFMQTWEELYVGEMILPVFNGPSEGILLVVYMCMLSVFYGSAWWHKPSVDVTFIIHYLSGFVFWAKDDVPQLLQNSIPMLAKFTVTPFFVYSFIGYIFCIGSAMVAVKRVIKFLRWHKDHEALSTLAFCYVIVRPIQDLITYFLFFVSFTYVCLHSTVAFPQRPLWMMIAMGGSFIELMLHLLLKHICHSKSLPGERMLLHLMYYMALNTWANNFAAEHQVIVVCVNEHWFVVAYAVIVMIYVVYSIYRIIDEMTTLFNIRVFSIKKH